MTEPAIRENQEIKRKPDGTFEKGVSGNPSGRPKGTLKDYLRRKFMEMTDEEKEKFLKKIDPIDQFKMAEGNPHQSSDETVEVTMPKPLLEALRKEVKPEEPAS